jgi:hypothetical protein
MKQLNWTKIPINKVKGSYWDSLDDESVKLDLGTFDLLLLYLTHPQTQRTIHNT